MAEGPRIYNLFPPLVGTVEDWQARLEPIRDMHFNWVFLNPFHLTGGSGSLYAVRDYFRLNPLLRTSADVADDELLARFTARARDLGLDVMFDLVINHTARDSELVAEHPDWYARDEQGQVRSPYAVDPDDPKGITVWGDLAEIDYENTLDRAGLLTFWKDVVRHYIKLGFHGFRCDAAYKVPGEVWAEIIAAARGIDSNVVFVGETLGAQLAEVQQLRSAGFDYFFNSAKWWDFRKEWLLEQYELFRHIAPSIAFPETHDTARLARESGGEARDSRYWYLFSAFFSSGVMMPVGYEYGFRRDLHVVETRKADWEEPAFDISDFIAATNRWKAEIPVLNEEGRQTRFTAPEAPLVGLLRHADDDSGRVAALINPNGDPQAYGVGDLAAVLGVPPAEIHDITPQGEPVVLSEQAQVMVEPRTLRIFQRRG